MDERRKKYFMGVARETASLSYAEKLKVGAVAVNEGRIICTGYNGTPPGEDNTCEVEIWNKWLKEYATWVKGVDPPGPDDDLKDYQRVLKTKPDVEHAERNLFDYAAREGIRLKGASLFITHSPCMPCARAIFNVGIQECYYETLFKDKAGVEWLSSRIRVCQVC